jgi:hypothetical protein
MYLQETVAWERRVVGHFFSYLHHPSRGLRVDRHWTLNKLILVKCVVWICKVPQKPMYCRLDCQPVVLLAGAGGFSRWDLVERN